MPSPNRRFLIVPEHQFEPSLVVRAQGTASGAPREEAGRSVRQPSVDETARPAGDIRPILLGTPEAHVEGGLRVAKSGQTDMLRWGWLRDGDDDAADLQLRQSVHVSGRRPDLVHRSTTACLNRPKLLSLQSGDALCVWISHDRIPLFAENDLGGVVQYSRLQVSADPGGGSENDWWTAAVSMTLEGVTSDIPERVDLDVVQFPDDGEIVLALLAQDANVSPTDRRLLVYVSTDDGDTWNERARCFFEGDDPEIVLDSDGDGAADDSGPLVSCAMEMTDSGRLVLVLRTEERMWSLTSDDRGVTWSATHVALMNSDESPGQGVAIAKARNGRLVVVYTRRGTFALSVASGTLVQCLLTADGVNFSSTKSITDTNSNYCGILNVAVAIRPDGWPHVFGASHYHDSGSLVTNRDWLVGCGLKTRDPHGGLDADQLFVSTRFTAFHCANGAAGSGTYDTDPPNVQVIGYHAVDVVCHRGALLAVASVVRQSSSGSDPGLSESALVALRLAHFQPLQERLTDSRSGLGSVPASPARGRIYNVTWEPYGTPDNWGFTAAGTGTATIVTSVPDNGYLKITCSSAQKNYTDTTLPAPNGGTRGVVRCVFRVDTGGSLLADQATLRLYLDDGAGLGRGIKIRAYRAGSDTSVGVYDAVGGNLVGTTQAVTNGQWIEVVASMDDGTSGLVSAYCRGYDRDADPEWDCPYLVLAEDEQLDDGTLTDELSFGCFTSATVTSAWKRVSLHRTANTFPSGGPLIQRGADYIDDDARNTQATAGDGLLTGDYGLDNIMRCGQGTTVPPQWFCRGVHVEWRGEAMCEGNFDHASGYDFGRNAVLQLPVSRREWRSTSTGDEIEIVLDAGADGHDFRPDAVALFGRNFPRVRVELNASDSWGSPSVRMTLGYPGDDGSPDRYAHLWAFDTGNVSWSYQITKHRLTVTSAYSRGPWRPHQFRSLRTGPRFYVVFKVDSSHEVFRIEDNTEDTLILHSLASAEDSGPVGSGNPELGYTFADDWAIFSDRLAVTFDHKYSSGADVGYRYVRLLLQACTHNDADEDFYRLGYVVFGRAVEISTPDAQQGWQVGTDSGFEVARALGGGSAARRRGSPRRTWSLGYGHLFPPAEASATTLSPAQQPARRTAGHWLDLVRRLEVDGVPAALIWSEGNRAVGQAGEARVQVASDPEGLALVRLAAPGSAEHVFWDCRELNLPGGNDTVPRPMVRVSGITFIEEL